MKRFQQRFFLSEIIDAIDINAEQMASRTQFLNAKQQKLRKLKSHGRKNNRWNDNLKNHSRTSPDVQFREPSKQKTKNVT